MPFFLQKGLKNLCKLLFAARTYVAIDELSVLEEEHGRYIHDTVLLAGVGVVIDIEFADDDTAFVLVGEFLEDWEHHLTRSAPSGPEINYYGFV